jgi:hypothetical protein
VCVCVCASVFESFIYCHTFIFLTPGSTPPGAEEYTKISEAILTATSGALVYVRSEVC